MTPLAECLLEQAALKENINIYARLIRNATTESQDLIHWKTVFLKSQHLLGKLQELEKELRSKEENVIGS